MVYEIEQRREMVLISMSFSFLSLCLCAVLKWCWLQNASAFMGMLVCFLYLFPPLSLSACVSVGEGLVGGWHVSLLGCACKFICCCGHTPFISYIGLLDVLSCSFFVGLAHFKT